MPALCAILEGSQCFRCVCAKRTTEEDAHTTTIYFEAVALAWEYSTRLLSSVSRMSRNLIFEFVD